MRINHNIAALNTHRQLGTAQDAQKSSMEKLSSGLRINGAKDDAAGLAISEKMRGQIRGLDQASANAQDANSMIQTAEGALNETHDILQRMRELSVQSSNGTNTDADRGEIQKEVNQLAEEIDRISETTEFNTKKLLNGDLAVNASSTTAGVENVTVTNDSITAGTYTMSAATTAVTTGMTVGSSSIVGFDAAADMVFAADGDFENLDLGSYTLKSTDAGSGNFKIELLDDSGKVVAKNDSTATTGSAGATLSGANGEVFTLGQNSITSTGEAKFSVEATTSAPINLLDGGGKVVHTLASGASTVNGEFQVGDLTVELNSEAFADSDNLAATQFLSATVTNNAETFQIGANEGQVTKLGISDMGAKSLGVDSLDLSTTEGAQASITAINDAIESVSGERSKLGANQNRLEHTINNLGTSSENLTAAESRIRDVDMAKEMMNQTKNSILAQAAQAMLAQANQQPQGVLQLLQ